jgi:FkbM family methyltransferase
LVGQRSFRETVLNALSDRGHLIYCEFPDGKFFVDPADRVVGTNLMWRGSWQRNELAQSTQVLKESGRFRARKTFIDVGANIGTHTVYALNSGDFGSAIAFEPEPSNLRLLAMNASINGYKEQVSVRGKAIGNAVGTATLHLHPRNKAAHSIALRPSYDGTQSIKVPLTRLDIELSSLATDDIGLVWIDVEGLEPEVIESLGEFLGAVPLAVEYAPFRYSKQRRDALDDLLIGHYNCFHLLGETLSPQKPIEDIRSVEGIVDVVVY